MITGRIYRAVRRLIPGGRRRPRMASDTLWTAAFLRWIGMFYRFMPARCFGRPGSSDSDGFRPFETPRYPENA